jgi:hypothetical protein
MSNNVGIEKSRKYLRINVLLSLVRSEGGEDVSNFNSLRGWAKGQVHFPPIGAFQAERQSSTRLGRGTVAEAA